MGEIYVAKKINRFEMEGDYCCSADDLRGEGFNAANSRNFQ